MIRPITRDDLPHLPGLLEAVGLFSPEDLDELRKMIEAALSGEAGPEHRWLIDDDGGPVAVAYYAPERMTVGTWNLYLIAVHPDRRRQGRAEALLRRVEADLIERGARLILVETAADPDFEGAWALYRKAGFAREARIRDFYAAGMDKLVYRKALAPAAD